jgi:predicted transposase YdaD
MDLISTIMVYKFNNLTRDEVDTMLGIQLEQTRVYQDAKAEGEVIGLERGRSEGEQLLVLKQLTRKLGTINPEIKVRVNSLNIDRIESLGEDLLDFTQISDLVAWLDTNQEY